MLDDRLNLRRTGTEQALVDRNAGRLDDQEARRLRTRVLHATRQVDPLSSGSAVQFELDQVAPPPDLSLDLFDAIWKLFVIDRAIPGNEVAGVRPALAVILQMELQIDLAPRP